MEHAARLDAIRALRPTVDEVIDEMEEQRHLSPAVVEGMRATEVFRAAVPTDVGGPQLDPMSQIEMVEEFSRLDGSVGWCAMIGAASSFASGYLDRAVAQRWFGSPDACLAGQLQPTGRAERVPGGYRASGRFRFGSGISHSTVVLAGCVVTVDGEIARHESGRPELRTVLFDPSQCTVLETWDTTGLRGTGSNDYVLDEVFIAEEDSYDPAGRIARGDPLYQFAPIFLAPHYGVPLGIARRAIDDVSALVMEKTVPPPGIGEAPKLCDNAQVQEAIALAEAELGGARAMSYATIGDMWETLTAGERVSRRQRGMYRTTMSWAHQVAKNVVSSMFDVATTSSIGRGSSLDRQLRDIVTACQHRIVHTRVYAPAGRLILGLDSGDATV